MAGVVQNANGEWKIDRDFLTPARNQILDRLEKRHEAEKSQRDAR